MDRAVAPIRFGLAIVLALIGLAGGARAVELEGDWHVLVHYRDAASGKPEQWRWEDRVWHFERDGDRLVWTDYPIVVFHDESGRFERLGTNRQSRVLGAWEPDEGQRSNIAAGLEVNPRGAKTKRLRGSDATGWSSGGHATAASANLLTYTETWTIESPSELPVFMRTDVLGGARAEDLEGVTRYATAAVESDGNLLRGTWLRDGTREGTFRMTRSGTTQAVRGSGRSNAERVRELFFGSAAALGDGGAADRPEPEAPEEVWQAVRTQVREELERSAIAQGESPGALEAELDRLADEIVGLMREGRSREEIERRLREGRQGP